MSELATPTLVGAENPAEFGAIGIEGAYPLVVVVVPFCDVLVVPEVSRACSMETPGFSRPNSPYHIPG